MSVVSNDRSPFVITEENVSVPEPESLELDRTMIFSLLPLLLLLLTSVSADPSARLGRKNLSDEDLLKALAILLAEAEGEVPRHGRTQELEEEARQGPGRGLARQDDFEALDGECTTTGYEVRTREECEEIHEIKCETINVTKHRQEIVPKCETLVDQQCNVTYVDVPSQQCRARQRNRCETIYKVVEDREYREECKVDVQHVCEHHVPVEVPYPIEAPYAMEATTNPPPEPLYNPGSVYGPPIPPEPVYNPPAPPAPVYNPPIPPEPVYSPPNNPGAVYRPPIPPAPAPAPAPASYQFVPYSGGGGEELAETQYQYDPTPGPQQAVSRLSRETSQPEVVPLFSRARRRRRSVLFPSTENINVGGEGGLGGSRDSQDQLRDLVRDILSNVMTNNQQLGKLKATIKEPRSINPVNYDLNLLQPHQDHHHLGGKLSLDQHILGGGPVHHHHHGGEVGGGLPVPPAPEPVVTTHELPAPEGCRSLAVKECVKIPIIVPRKVPYEVSLVSPALPPAADCCVV